MPRHFLYFGTKIVSSRFRSLQNHTTNVEIYGFDGAKTWHFDMSQSFIHIHVLRSKNPGMSRTTRNVPKCNASAGNPGIFRTAPVTFRMSLSIPQLPCPNGMSPPKDTSNCQHFCATWGKLMTTATKHLKAHEEISCIFN